jgi:hypothetical protein
MFSVRLRRANQVRDYKIRDAGSDGWEVRLEEDRTVRRLERYQDWHRVERALALFEREVNELTASGWQVAPTSQ